MRFLPLFEVRLSHGFYTDGRCPDLRVEPTESAAALVRRHRLTLETYSGGLRVFTPVQADGWPQIPFTGGMMNFDLRVLDQRLPLFTDMSPYEGKDHLVFHNIGVGSGGVLIIGNPPDTPRARGSFGTVAIGLGRFATVQPGASSPVYEVSLAPKTTRWTYYVVTDTISESVALVDADPSAGYTPLGFDADNNPRDLAVQPDPNDPIATSLAERYPDHRRMRFVTNEPVPLRQAPRPWLELHLDGFRQASALPNPSLMDRTTVEIATGLEPSLFRLIKHITPNSSPV